MKDAGEQHESTLSDSDRELLENGEVAIRHYLAAAPDALERLDVVLARRLDGRMNTDTWRVVYSSLETLLGEDGATVVAWTATAEPSPVEDIASVVEPDVANFVRTITAAYGAELRQAYELSRELPNNWRYVNREVYFDLIRNKPYIRFEVETYSNKKMLLEGPPDSMLGLARNLLVTLKLVGSRDAFDDDVTARFIDTANDLLSMLSSDTSVSEGSGALGLPEAEHVRSTTTVD
jgi:hypothetical protein